jgi:hypothetical protein
METKEKIKSLVSKWGSITEDDFPRSAKAFNRVLIHISKEAFNLGTQSIQESHLNKDNHKIGIELESYCNVLLCRGLQKEHDMLLEVASRLK